MVEASKSQEGLAWVTGGSDCLGLGNRWTLVSAPAQVTLAPGALAAALVRL